MRLVRALLFLIAVALLAETNYPAARFADPQRVDKLQSALPEVDAIFRRFAENRKITGMVWGVVVDGKLAHVGATGVQDRATNTPVNADSVFRIASMTKSFTALAVLKLRDEGKTLARRSGVEVDS